MGQLLPTPGTFKPNEVLAINLDAAGLAKVLNNNYEVIGKAELPEFGFHITRLKIPESQNAIAGRGNLHELVPEGGFSLNRIYRVGSGAAPKGAGAGGRAVAPGMGCAAERCFGTGLINWHPQLAACARDIKIGIVDTGFDKGHPAFAGARYVYKEFLPEKGAKASNQHGTGIFSLLAGNAHSGTPGLIPDAVYTVANAFFADASGQPISDTALMLEALQWLKKSGVAIANLSFAGPEDELVHHVVKQLAKEGVVIVAAAGNDGPSAPPSYPAAYKEVMAVTAVDRNLAPYRYASRGDHIDVAAPGVDVWTALPGRREGPQTGTSFAVPYVTAVIALNYPTAEARSDGDPFAPKRNALALLQKNIKGLAGRGRDPTFGAGLVQAPAHCEAPSALAKAAPKTEAWTGTVQRASDPAPNEPAPVGPWTSTVQTVSSKEVRR